MKRLLPVLALSMLPLAAHADSPRPVVPRVFASEPEGNAIFRMIPPTWDAQGRETPGRGIAERMEPDGRLVELYRTEGWYAFKVHLSADGRLLVRMGPWNRGSRPEKSHLAVAFYKDGKLVRQYSPPELLKDPSKVRASVSHYEWLAHDANYDETEPGAFRPRLDYFNKFTLKTVDGWTHRFDADTGKLETSTPPARK